MMLESRIEMKDSFWCCSYDNSDERGGGLCFFSCSVRSLYSVVAVFYCVVLCCIEFVLNQEVRYRTIGDR